MKCVKMLQRTDQEKYRLKEEEKSLVNTKEKSSWMFVAQMGLQCRNIWQLIAYLDILLFDIELATKRRTADYYKTLFQIRLTLPSWNDRNENRDVFISIIS